MITVNKQFEVKSIRLLQGLPRQKILYNSYRYLLVFHINRSPIVTTGMFQKESLSWRGKQAAGNVVVQKAKIVVITKCQSLYLKTAILKSYGPFPECQYQTIL